MNRDRNTTEAALAGVLVTLATAAVVWFAFSPECAGQPSLLVAIGGLYVVVAAAAIYRMRARGELAKQMRPHSGDLTVGALTAALMYGVATAGHMALTGRGSPREGWIMRVYLQIGDPELEGRVLVSAAVFVIAALEEIAWRGLVFRALAAKLSVSRAWLVTTLLYAAAHIPTIFLLADAKAGPNPMIVAAALGCGLAWGRIAMRADRLTPAIFSHALFSWAVVEFPIWRP